MATQNTIATTGYPYTIADNGVNTSWGSSAATIANSGTLALTGPSADITVNGVSLLDTLNQLKQRLNLLVPNPKIEAEWEELKILGDQYRALEAELMSRQQVWDLLKKEY